MLNSVAHFADPQEMMIIFILRYRIGVTPAFRANQLNGAVADAASSGGSVASNGAAANAAPSSSKFTLPNLDDFYV